MATTLVYMQALKYHIDNIRPREEYNVGIAAVGTQLRSHKGARKSEIIPLSAKIDKIIQVYLAIYSEHSWAFV
jgi:hypothetical protein